MEASIKAGLQAGDVTFGIDDAELLRAIADHGSVSGAAEALGRSRARALGRLEVLEEALGPLVDRTRGGAGGGGSQLTEDAWTLLARLDRLQATLTGTADAPELVFHGEVIEREGELGRIETSAGRIRAILIDRVNGGDEDEPGERDTADSEGESTNSPLSRLKAGSQVQVGVRADTVTLHAPDDTPAESATSARNRFRGTVTGIDRGISVAHVTVDIGAEDPLIAVVTEESRDRLGLAEGIDVVASFKATATRATATDR
jgi:molybdate transport system regulatory protein